jgi:hypothetical protein
MSIVKLEGRNLTAAINTINKASNPAYVQQVLVSIAFSAFNGNTDPLNKASMDSWNPLQRKWLFDNVVKTCTSKNKETKHYENNTEKRFLSLAILLGQEEFDGNEMPAFDTIAELLPFWNPEKAKEVKKFDAIKRAKSLLVQANKALEDGNIEGEETVVQALIDALKPFNV